MLRREPDRFRRAGLAALAGAALLRPGRVHATAGSAFALETPDGSVIRNFPIDPKRAPADLPAVLVIGRDLQAPVLYEFFDYACPFCRVAAQELDLLLGPDSGLRLGLVHHPVLGEGSMQAARVAIATLRQHGEEAATRLHEAIFAAGGPVGAGRALALAGSLGLDPNAIRAQAARPEILAMLRSQIARADALGLRSTPSFVLGDFAFVGWPGPGLVQSFAQSLRRCGGLACTAPRP